MIKSKTGEFLESCKWAQDKLTWRDVKYVINGRSGGAGISVMSNIRSSGLSFEKREGNDGDDDNVHVEERRSKGKFRSFPIRFR